MTQEVVYWDRSFRVVYSGAGKHWTGRIWLLGGREDIDLATVYVSGTLEDAKEALVNEVSKMFDKIVTSEAFK